MRKIFFTLIVAGVLVAAGCTAQQIESWERLVRIGNATTQASTQPTE